MENTSRSHFLHSVLPAVETFTKFYSLRKFGLRTDTKNAAALANALRDLSEHVFFDIDDPDCNDGYKTERAYRESFWAEFKSYNVTCNFADAWKHRKLSRKDRLLNSVDDIQEHHFLIRYKDDEGFYYSSRKFLAVHLNDGNQYDLAQMLYESTQLWIQEMLRRDLIDAAPTISPLPSFYQSRKEAASAPPMRMEFYTSEPVHVPQACFIYDLEKQELRPIASEDTFDYSCNVEMEVFRSPIEAEQGESLKP